MISYQEWRAAELRGAATARTLHDRLGLRSALRDGDQAIDIFEAIRLRDLTLVFKPLKSLLGAYVKYGGATGLLVTTERDLHIQRFTAAHELGHAEFGHPATSLDKDIGFAARGPMRGAHAQPQSVHEVEADAFASEFLLPKWLIAAHVRRRRWTLKHLTSPDVVYQLSLRLGASYSATCWALSANSIVPKRIAQKLVAVPPKNSKQRVLRGFKPDSWQKIDVWLLSEPDRGIRVLGDPHDKLVLELQEHPASGYVWDFDGSTEGLSLERADEPVQQEEDVVGDANTRRLILSGEAYGRVRLIERRPWDNAAPAINSFSIELGNL